MSSYNRILAYNKQTQSWQNVNCDPNGNLVVVVSNTSEAGNASSGNQLIQIDKAEIANGYLSNITTKLNGTLTVQLPGGVNISTQELQVDQLERMDATNSYLQSINTDMATSAKQTEIKNEIIHSNITLTHINSNIISSNVVLSSIKTATELTAQEAYEIRAEITPIKVESAYADVITQSAILGADTNPAFTQHPVFDGWYYNNTVSGGASNLYYYANQTGQQKQYTVAECLGSYAVCRILTFTNVNTVPFLVIYSRPQGAGDAVPGFYRSRWVYRINNVSIDSSGMEFLMYAKTLPDSRIFPNVRRIPATLILTNGPALETETLEFLTVNTDSSATQNTVSVVYSAVGYNLLGTYHNLELSAGKQNEKVYLADKIALTNQEATQQLIKAEVISTNSLLTDANNSLQSIDTNMATSALQTDIKNELITLNNTGLMTDATGLSIDANLLLVLDELQNGTISVDISEPLEFDPDDGGLIVHVANSTGGGGDASSANQETQIQIAEDSNISICSRLDGSNSVLQTISSNIKFCNTSPLLTESTYQLGNVAICSRLDGSNSVLQDFQTNGVKSLVYAGGFPIDSTMYITGRQALSVSIENNAVEVGVNNFPSDYARDDTLTASNLAVCTRLETINASLSNISGGGGNSNVTVLNSNLNTRIFGSHDGTTWHHILTTPQGKILVNSSTQDGNGTNISSTVESTKTGLDTYIINPSIQVSNIWLSNIGSIDTKATTINTSIGQTNTILSGQTIQLNDIILETQTNNTKTQNIVDNSNTIISSIGTTNSYLASGNILLDDLKTEAEATNTHLTTIESGLATIEATIGTATQKVSIYDSTETALTSSSNRLNTNAYLLSGAGDTITATGSSINVNQTNNPTEINIKDSSGASLSSTSGALNNYITNFPSVYKRILPTSSQGSYGNLLNGPFAAQVTTAILDVTNYTDSVVSYEDQSFNNTGTIILYGTITLTAPIDLIYIGRLIPIYGGNGITKRFATCKVSLGPFKGICAYNDNILDNNLACRISVISEGLT
jgi:hypothetical protein